jgi:hypothetical protein
VCHYAECSFAESLYAECHDLFIVMLNVIMLSVILLVVVMLSVVAPIYSHLLLLLQMEKKLSASTLLFYFSSLFGSLCNISSKASSCSIAVKALTTDQIIKGLNPEAVYLVMCDPFMNEL